jgi:hypothetical protein
MTSTTHSVSHPRFKPSGMLGNSRASKLHTLPEQTCRVSVVHPTRSSGTMAAELAPVPSLHQALEDEMLSNLCGVVQDEREEATLAPLHANDVAAVLSPFRAQVTRAAAAMYTQYDADGELEDLKTREGDWCREYLFDYVSSDAVQKAAREAVPSAIAYKFLAECQVDVDRFKALLQGKYTTFVATPGAQGLPDVECEFTSTEALQTLRALMRSISDGHLMLQSLNVASEYTGDRWYDDDDDEEEEQGE